MGPLEPPRAVIDGFASALWPVAGLGHRLGKATTKLLADHSGSEISIFRVMFSYTHAGQPGSCGGPRCGSAGGISHRKTWASTSRRLATSADGGDPEPSRARAGVRPRLGKIRPLLTGLADSIWDFGSFQIDTVIRMLLQ
jgi:hypothetical protein